MPVGIIQVTNNTGKVLHYKNQQSGYTFDLNPTTKTKTNGGEGGSTSTYHDDTVPYKSSGFKITVAVDHGGPHFSVCDDYYKFSIVGIGKTEEWSQSFSNGDQFVMIVDSSGVKFVEYIPNTYLPLPRGLVTSLITKVDKTSGSLALA